jgi:hypothetical protein
MELDGIDSFDGSQVLLLWPPVLGSRTWDGGFFSPILFATLPKVNVIRTMFATEVETWWERLDLPK